MDKLDIAIAKHKKMCSEAVIKFNAKYDCYGCITCNEYIDDPCRDNDCGFCSERPIFFEEDHNKSS